MKAEKSKSLRHMKEILTIGEFASLRGITAETLRHYDRIGLLKPAFTDPATGYRYYSVLQYEQLSTILELRQMGMSLSEIGGFLSGRSPQSALSLLRERRAALQEEIASLCRLETAISSKIGHLEAFIGRNPSDSPRLLNLPERHALAWSVPLDSGIITGYGFARLEEQLNELAPIFAASRYGLLMPSEAPETGKAHSTLLLFTEEPALLSGTMGSETIKILRIPSGLYASALLYRPDASGLMKVKQLRDSFRSQGYRENGDLIFIAQIDLSVTGSEDAVLYEMQLPLARA